MTAKALNAIDTTCIPCCLGMGLASGKMGHMFWSRTADPDVPAASQLTLTPLGLPLGSVFLQATRGRGLEVHQMGRLERSPSTGKSIAQKNHRSFYPLRKMVKFSGPTGLRGSADPLNGSHGLCGVCWVRCPRAPRATPRAGTPAVAGSLTVGVRKRVFIT